MSGFSDPKARGVAHGSVYQLEDVTLVVEGLTVEIWDSEVLKEIELRKLFRVEEQLEIIDAQSDVATIKNPSPRGG